MGNGSPAALAGSPLMKNMEISSVQSGQQMKLLSPRRCEQKANDPRSPAPSLSQEAPPSPFRVDK